MRIVKDRASGIVKFSEEKYIQKVFEKFNMENVKSKSTFLGIYLKLFKS